MSSKGLAVFACFDIQSAVILSCKYGAQVRIVSSCVFICQTVSPHAATYIKKDMLRLKENGLDERMTLEENKTFFHEIAHMHCDAAITAQIRYSNKSYRATLTKESILEKCRICDLDAQSVKQILKAAGFDAGGDQHE